MARLTVARPREAILRTATVAQRSDGAAFALGRQRVELVLAELALLGRCDELQHMPAVNVAQPITRLDEVIAGVEIAVVLQHRAVAAGRGVNAEQMPPEIRLQRHVEELHVDVPDIVAHPLLEDIDEQSAILLAACGALGDEVTGLRVEQALVPGRSLQPWLASARVSSVARSTTGMNCIHFAPSSSRKNL